MRASASWLAALAAVSIVMVAADADAQKMRMRNYEKTLDGKLSSHMKPGWKYEISMNDSSDGKGQDVELRLTMPINDFMEFAPVAALEAASVPHAFPVVYIYLRETTTRRVGRVAFVDADKIAGRYLAGDKGAVQEMKEAIIWH